MDKKKINNIMLIKRISRTALMVLAAFWFGFGLLSGAERFGGGFTGVLTNLPNALPWFLLLVFVYLSWHYEIISGVLIIAVGLVSLFFYNAWGSPLVLFVISLPILVLGTALLVTAVILRRLKAGGKSSRE